MTDKTQEYVHLWSSISADGHPSYSPDTKRVVTDTYPDRARIAYVKVMDENKITVIARLFSPFDCDNNTRCDLHPHWSRDGKKIAIDSVFQGRRGLYTIEVDK